MLWWISEKGKPVKGKVKPSAKAVGPFTSKVAACQQVELFRQLGRLNEKTK